MSDDKVVGIHGGPMTPMTGEPVPSLIKMLDDLLAMAKSGQLRTFIGTGFVEDGGRLTMWGPQWRDVYQMQGSLSWLVHEHVARVTGQADTL